MVWKDQVPMHASVLSAQPGFDPMPSSCPDLCPPMQCPSNPGAEQAPFSHSGTFLFKDPAVDCPTGQQEMSFNCALHTERKIGPASKLHVSFPYPLSIPISMCRQHIHIHNISIHIHEPCPDFRPQDQVPPNNPIGIQGEAGKEITAVYQLSKCTLVIDFFKNMQKPN